METSLVGSRKPIRYRCRTHTRSGGWTSRSTAFPSLDAGIAREGDLTDAEQMIWPVAALAVGLLGFVIAYGSVVQFRLASSRNRRERS
jgi:hypothetical protein